MAEKNVGSLAQTYAQIVMGYLSEAIIKFQTFKAKKLNQSLVNSGNLLISPGFQSVIKRIESAFGDLNLVQEQTEQYDLPVIAWADLFQKFLAYLKMHNIVYRAEIFSAVMQDLQKLGLLAPKIALRNDPNVNPLYAISTGVFENQALNQPFTNLKDALNDKLGKVIKNKVAREILLTLSLTASITDEELQNLDQSFRKNIFFHRYGRGILLAMLRGRGIKYRPFMNTVDLLVRNNILIEACGDLNYEVIILNPVLKPFSVLREVIRLFREPQSETKIIEMEIDEENATPLSSMINIGSSGGDSKDIFLFDQFEIGLQGL